MLQGWRDERLSWNPDDFGDVDTLRISANRIWTPDIRLYNESVSRHNAGVSAVFSRLTQPTSSLHYLRRRLREQALTSRLRACEKFP